MINYPDNLEYKRNYTNYKNKLQVLLRKAKDDYYDNKLNQISGDNKKLWKFINKKIGKNTEKKPIKQIFCNTQNKLIDNDKDISNTFNNFFINVGPNLASKFKKNPNTSDLNEFKSSIQKTIFLYPTSGDEITKIIQKLDTNKAAGGDNISCKVVKTIAKYISEPLACILNNCIATATFPDKFKIADVIPILKSGDPENTTNYRPISLISNLAKIFEKIIKVRIEDFISSIY